MKLSGCGGYKRPRITLRYGDSKRQDDYAQEKQRVHGLGVRKTTVNECDFAEDCVSQAEDIQHQHYRSLNLPALSKTWRTTKVWNTGEQTKTLYRRCQLGRKVMKWLYTSRFGRMGYDSVQGDTLQGQECCAWARAGYPEVHKQWALFLWLPQAILYACKLVEHDGILYGVYILILYIGRHMQTHQAG